MARGRQPVQRRCQDEHEQHARHELGERDAHQPDGAHDPVPQRIGTHARPDARGHGDRHAECEGEEGQDERVSDPAREDLADRLLLNVGVAEVPSDDAADPVQIPDMGGTVQAELGAKGGEPLLGRLLLEHHLRDVARQDLGHHEDDAGDHQQGHADHAQARDQEAQHRSPVTGGALLSTSAVRRVKGPAAAAVSCTPSAPLAHCNPVHGTPRYSK